MEDIKVFIFILSVTLAFIAMGMWYKFTRFSLNLNKPLSSFVIWFIFFWGIVVAVTSGVFAYFFLISKWVK